MDLFTKRKLLLSMAVVLSVTFTYYILQSHWSYTRLLAEQEKDIQIKAKLSASCANHRFISRCEKCPRQELKDIVSYCGHTGYKRLIECDDGKKEYIWCEITPGDEEADFWKFQALCLFLALSSYSVVYLRQRKLDKILMEKIHKQIASGL